MLLNLIKHQRPDFVKIYLYVKDPFKSKYQLLINGREKVEIENLKNPKAFINYSQTIDDVYENLVDYNPTKKRRVLIVFDDMIADMESNKKKLISIDNELFLRGRKLTISLVFISQSYFEVSKTIRLNTTHFIIKIPSKRELQQIASNHSSDTGFKDFRKLYKDYTKEPYSFLVNDTTLSSTYYKMSISEKIKVIDNKIEPNKAQYNLDRRTAQISALLSGNVSKYEFLTGKAVLLEKDLLEKVVAIKRFEYSSLGKEMKKQTSAAEKQYQKFESNKNEEKTKS